jgi:hypothetical protein
MATIEIAGDDLIVKITGWDRVWTMSGSLTVPLKHVAGASSGEAAAHEWYQGLRLGGTNIPGVLIAGSWVFWDVHDPALAVAIDLHDEHYARLIIQVADPTATIAAIQAAVG